MTRTHFPQINEFVRAVAKRKLPDAHGVTETMYKLMEHAIGLDDRMRPYRRNGKTYFRAYRNYYETPDFSENPTTAIWNKLVSLGYAENPEKCWYHLTESGMSLIAARHGIYKITEVD